MAKLKDNKAIAMLDAAAAGKYGIPAVVVVRLSPSPPHLQRHAPEGFLEQKPTCYTQTSEQAYNNTFSNITNIDFALSIRGGISIYNVTSVS